MNKIYLLLVSMIFLYTIEAETCTIKSLIPSNDTEWGFVQYECLIEDGKGFLIPWGNSILSVNKTKRYNEFYIYLNGEQLLPSSLILNEGDQYSIDDSIKIKHVSYSAVGKVSTVEIILEKRPSIFLRYEIEKSKLYSYEKFYVDLFIRNCGYLNAKNISIKPIYDKFITLELIEPTDFISTLYPSCREEKIRFHFKLGGIINTTKSEIVLGVYYEYINLATNKLRKDYQSISIPIEIIGGVDVKIFRNITYPWDFERNKPKEYAEPNEKVRITDTIYIRGTCKKGYKMLVENEYPSVISVIGDNEFSGDVNRIDEIVLSYLITSSNEIEFTQKLKVRVIDKCIEREFFIESKPITIKFKKVRKIAFDVDYYINDIYLKELEKEKIKAIKLNINKSYKFKTIIHYAGNVVLKNISIQLSILNATQHVLSLKNINLEYIYPNEKISNEIIYTFRSYGEYSLVLTLIYYDEYYNRYEKVERKLKIYVGLYIRCIPSYSIVYDPKIKGYLFNLKISISNEGPLTAKEIWMELKYPEKFIVKDYTGRAMIGTSYVTLKLDELNPDTVTETPPIDITFFIPEKGVYNITTIIHAKDGYNNVYEFLCPYTLDIARYILFEEANLSIKLYFEKTKKNYVEIPLGYKVKLITVVENNGNRTGTFLLNYIFDKLVQVINGSRTVKLTIKPNEKIILYHELKPFYYGVFRNILEIIGENLYKQVPFKINVTGKYPKLLFDVFFNETKKTNVTLTDKKQVTIIYTLKNVGDVYCDIDLKFINLNKTFTFRLNPGDSVRGSFNVKATKNMSLEAIAYIKNFELELKKNLNLTVYTPTKKVPKVNISKKTKTPYIKVPTNKTVIQKRKIFNKYLLAFVVGLIIVIILVIRRLYY